MTAIIPTHLKKFLEDYTIVPKGTNHNYGAYIKKADFYSTDEVREELKKYIADQKVRLENYYKSQLLKLDGMLDG